MNNKILLNDFKSVLENEIDFKSFRNKTILITGGTGFIGSLIARFFLYANKERNFNTRVIVTARNLSKADSVYSEYPCQDYLKVIKWDYPSELDINESNIDFIIHTAAITSSKQMVSDPIGVINLSIDGLRDILYLAENFGSRVLYVSSMEMYGNPNLNRKVSERDYGYIDLSNPRSCYPEAKRMCECLCTAYHSQKKVNVCSARLAQTFGAGISVTENRVFAQFARSAVRGENIVLHTKGQSEGNYVYSSDALAALLTILLKGEAAKAYNVVNEDNHCSIADMAKLVSDNYGKDSSKVIFDIPEHNQYGYPPDTKLFLSSENLRKLGWKPKVNLIEAYGRMIAYMGDDWAAV